MRVLRRVCVLALGLLILAAPARAATVAIFYYPWYGTPAHAGEQMAELGGAGVDTVIVSWWGRGSSTDRRLPAVLAAARRSGLGVAAHLEPYSGRSLATIAADLRYLAGLGIQDVYVYEARD